MKEYPKSFSPESNSTVAAPPHHPNECISFHMKIDAHWTPKVHMLFASQQNKFNPLGDTRKFSIVKLITETDKTLIA